MPLKAPGFKGFDKIKKSHISGSYLEQFLAKWYLTRILQFLGFAVLGFHDHFDGQRIVMPPPFAFFLKFSLYIWSVYMQIQM